MGVWIVRRKYPSALVALLISGGIVATHVVMNAYSGKLSDPIQRGGIIDAVYGIGTVTAYRRFSFNRQITRSSKVVSTFRSDTVERWL